MDIDKSLALRQLIVKWKYHAIDLATFEKTTCFNIGNGAT